jgi:hypothetical protein
MVATADVDTAAAASASPAAAHPLQQPTSTIVMEFTTSAAANDNEMAGALDWDAPSAPFTSSVDRFVGSLERNHSLSGIPSSTAALRYRPTAASSSAVAADYAIAPASADDVVAAAAFGTDRFGVRFRAGRGRWGMTRHCYVIYKLSPTLQLRSRVRGCCYCRWWPTNVPAAEPAFLRQGAATTQGRTSHVR